MPSSFDPRPLTLEGEHVRLEPLAPGHAADLFVAGADPLIWRYLPIPPPSSLGEIESWITEAIVRGETFGDIAFAVIDRASGRAAGSTRYLDIRKSDRALEIGWSWIGRAYQRTVINTECKYLLLAHAFDRLGAIRVQFKADARNERSLRAIERIGAHREGVLRKQRIQHDGYIRDAVYYSIIDDEWPVVKLHLEELLARR